jgi:hypothetical protein
MRVFITDFLAESDFECEVLPVVEVDALLSPIGHPPTPADLVRVVGERPAAWQLCRRTSRSNSLRSCSLKVSVSGLGPRIRRVLFHPVLRTPVYHSLFRPPSPSSVKSGCNRLPGSNSIEEVSLADGEKAMRMAGQAPPVATFVDESCELYQGLFPDLTEEGLVEAQIAPRSGESPV